MTEISTGTTIYYGGIFSFNQGTPKLEGMTLYEGLVAARTFLANKIRDFQRSIPWRYQIFIGGDEYLAQHLLDPSFVFGPDDAVLIARRMYPKGEPLILKPWEKAVKLLEESLLTEISAI